MRAMVLSAALLALCLPGWRAEAQSDNVNPAEIIRKFAAKEAEFAAARNNYTYRQTLKMQILDFGGNPTGQQWDLVEDIIFTPEGKRMEKVVYAPVSTIRDIMVTPEDEKTCATCSPLC